MAKKFKFRSSGNVTLGLRGSYKEVVRNAFGDPVTTKTVPAIRAVFDGGFFETDDQLVVDLIKLTANWGNDVFWDKSSLPEDSTPEDKTQAKKVADAQLARKKRKKAAQDAAKEGSVAKEQ